MRPQLCIIASMAAVVARSASCAAGFNGGDLSTTNPLSSSVSPPFRMAMCSAYNSDACCLTLQHQEIQDAYMHLIDSGYRCAEEFNERVPQMRAYFCMFCNPDQLKYMSCCANPTWEAVPGSTARVFKCGDAAPTMHGAGNCTSTAVNTIRVCGSFADRLFPDTAPGKPGTDICGMNIWSGATEVSATSPATDYNPNGIVSWGDVNGATGDDPVVPSKFWAEGVRGFLRDTKPPLFDQFFIEYVSSNQDCYNGPGHLAAASTAVLFLATLLARVARAA